MVFHRRMSVLHWWNSYSASILLYVNLGLTITSNLSFELHINNIVDFSKARKRTCLHALFIVVFSFQIDLYMMRQAFITYIKLIVEYHSVVWIPSYTYLINLIENVQRNVSKHIPSLSALPYLQILLFYET
jgi:hypothetical protein